ncbi:hypothetical protein [Luteolibacter sp. LG18]|uniref:hypothetical protein n=1 Tax=Luteolibacter sp. LG18 TaxID=2819286 RepID=UPI002B31CE0E|nr:hypothetical protein llg_17040 [Luteolibacter sp. LG18]
MSAKEAALDAIGRLSEQATWEEVVERIRFTAAIEKGLEEVGNGSVVSHEKVREDLQRWISE